jgi:hypothetical protein
MVSHTRNSAVDYARIDPDGYHAITPGRKVYDLSVFWLGEPITWVIIIGLYGASVPTLPAHGRLEADTLNPSLSQAVTGESADFARCMPNTP